MHRCMLEQRWNLLEICLQNKGNWSKVKRIWCTKFDWSVEGQQCTVYANFLVQHVKLISLCVQLYNWKFRNCLRVCVRIHKHRLVIILKNWTFHFRSHRGAFCLKTWPKWIEVFYKLMAGIFWQCYWHLGPI